MVGEFSIGGQNGGAVMADGYPWFPVENRLVRLNPETNEVDGVVEFSVAYHGYGTAPGFGSVWMAASAAHDGPRPARRPRELGDSVAGLGNEGSASLRRHTYQHGISP